MKTFFNYMRCIINFIPDNIPDDYSSIFITTIMANAYSDPTFYHPHIINKNFINASSNLWTVYLINFWLINVICQFRSQNIIQNEISICISGINLNIVNFVHHYIHTNHMTWILKADNNSENGSLLSLIEYIGVQKYMKIEILFILRYQKLTWLEVWNRKCQF